MVDRKAKKPAVRRRREPEEARTEILEAAERVFTKRGPDVVGLRDVAAEGGISHGLITHYFGTYDALVEAVFARRIQRGIEEGARRVLAIGPEATPIGLLRALIEAASEPVQLRLVGWAIVSGRFEKSDFFVGQQQGLRRVADAIAAASRATAEREGTEPISQPDIDAGLLLAISATYAYGFGRAPFLAALGWPRSAASDAHFIDHVIGMVDAYWSRPRTKKAARRK